MRTFFPVFGVPVVAVSVWLMQSDNSLNHYLAMSGLATFGCWLIALGRVAPKSLRMSAQRWLIYVSLGLFTASRVALNWQRGRPGESLSFIVGVIALMLIWQYFANRTQWE